jgi:hypothetical protein
MRVALAVVGGALVSLNSLLPRYGSPLAAAVLATSADLHIS